MRNMKKEKKTYDYIYKVPLMSITKYGTQVIDSIIVAESQDDDFAAEIGQERPIRNLSILELKDFPLHSLDFRFYRKDNVKVQNSLFVEDENRYSGYIHPTLYELQMVNGNTLYPALQPDDKIIYAVDSALLTPEHYATLKDVSDFIDNFPKSRLQEEIKNLEAVSLSIHK